MIFFVQQIKEWECYLKKIYLPSYEKKKPFLSKPYLFLFYLLLLWINSGSYFNTMIMSVKICLYSCWLSSKIGFQCGVLNIIDDKILYNIITKTNY